MLCESLALSALLAALVLLSHRASRSCPSPSVYMGLEDSAQWMGLCLSPDAWAGRGKDAPGYSRFPKQAVWFGGAGSCPGTGLCINFPAVCMFRTGLLAGPSARPARQPLGLTAPAAWLPGLGASPSAPTGLQDSLRSERGCDSAPCLGTGELGSRAGGNLVWGSESGGSVSHPAPCSDRAPDCCSFAEEQDLSLRYCLGTAGTNLAVKIQVLLQAPPLLPHGPFPSG